MPEQPPRSEESGEVAVFKLEEGQVCIRCVEHGAATCVVMSPFNAWRAFALLALLLGIPLPTKFTKKIKL